MDTRKYLERALELEKNIYTLDRLMGRLRAQEQNIDVMPKTYNEPRGRVRNDDILGAVLFGAIPGLVIGIIAGFIFLIIFLIVVKKMNLDIPDEVLVALWLAIGIAGTLIGFGKMDGFVRYYPPELAYEEKMKRYNELTKQDNLRVQNGIQQKKILNSEISVLSGERNKVKETLQQLYNLNVIYPKYRNFVAVATFYEYFSSGRCKSLEGHEGAYNIYENEVRLNTIINKLDDVISHLNEIKENQYAIYNAINEGNKKSAQIYKNTVELIANTNEIAQNSAIDAYCSYITAKNTEVLKYIALYGR